MPVRRRRRVSMETATEAKDITAEERVSLFRQPKQQNKH